MLLNVTFWLTFKFFFFYIGTLNVQPKAGKFLRFDHLTFWVGNAKQVIVNYAVGHI